MAYRLEEQLENGGTVILGDPIHDVLVAKVVASQRAHRTQRGMVVRDMTSGQEVAQYEGAPPLRAARCVEFERCSPTARLLGEKKRLIRRRGVGASVRCGDECPSLGLL